MGLLFAYEIAVKQSTEENNVHDCDGG